MVAFAPILTPLLIIVLAKTFGYCFDRGTKSFVKVEDKTVGEISSGLLLYVGITHDDSENDADYLVGKISKMRIFEDEDGKMNNSVVDNDGSILMVSQFTLYADCKKGNRPSFVNASPPEQATSLHLTNLSSVSGGPENTT